MGGVCGMLSSGMCWLKWVYVGGQFLVVFDPWLCVFLVAQFVGCANFDML